LASASRASQIFPFARRQPNVAAGKTKIEALKEVDALNACFATYEIPPENKSPPRMPI
jgi:hypothetical protein